MTDRENIVITGSGAVCGAGRTPADIWAAVESGQSAIRRIEQWDTTDWPRNLAAEVPNFKPRDLVPDRKVHKFIRRTDLLGIYAATEAIAVSGLIEQRDGLDEAAAEAFNDRSGIYVGSGGGNFANQYDYFPLFDAAQGSLEAFGRELENNVTPMWLLQALPNNVLCHVGIRLGFKGTNACITNHAVSGMLAVIEAAEGIRAGEADRAVAAGHDTPIEPQNLLYYHQLGLVAAEALRPFDANRDGSIFGEGAAALVLETKSAAEARGAAVLGEILGGGVATDAQGLVTIDARGENLAGVIAAALRQAGLAAPDVGAIVAHGNGTLQSDASEAAAIRTVFGDRGPPVTGFKWAYGHLIAASGILDVVMALEAMNAGVLPGIPTLTETDPAIGEFPVSRHAQRPRGDIVLVISRGFAGINAALLLSVPRRAG